MARRISISLPWDTRAQQTQLKAGITSVASRS